MEAGAQCGDLIVLGLYATMPMSMQARIPSRTFQNLPESFTSL